MRCSECFKKKERLFCKACSLTSPVISSKKLSLTQKIEIIKESLEEKVSHTLHFYFASQELKEKQVKIQHYKSILATMNSKKEDQLKIFRTFTQKTKEKNTNIKQLAEIKEKFMKQIFKNNEFLAQSEGKIQHLRKKLKKIQRSKVFYYNSILEINSIYPHWTIYKELIIEKESGFSPINDEEDIEASSSSIDDIDFEEIKEVILKAIGTQFFCGTTEPEIEGYKKKFNIPEEIQPEEQLKIMAEDFKDAFDRLNEKLQKEIEAAEKVSE